MVSDGTQAESMSTICIIPARGGSKRIPRKNVKLFAGLPMIAHSIAAARDSGVFDDIIISTDDDEIAAIGEQFGARVPFRRPPELANDHATTDAVLLHALGWLQGHGSLPDYFCCLYATAPFAQPTFLRRGLETLKETGAISAFSVTTFPFPIFRALKINESGRVEMFWPENRLKRSQDFPEAYHDAGQYYWADSRKYLECGHIYSDDAVPVILPRHLVQDIDTPEDWQRAELMYKALHA